MAKEKDLTEEDIRKTIEEIWNRKPVHPEREIVLYQGCKTHGYINRSTNDLNISTCDDPDCGGCRQFEAAMKEGITETKLPRHLYK